MEDLPRLDLSWLPGVLLVLLGAVVALVLWRLWLRYRRAGAPTEDSARSAGITAGADAVPELPVLLRLIGLLLVVWLVVSIIGAVVKGLFWLLVVGVVLFLATAAYGWLKSDDRI